MTTENFYIRNAERMMKSHFNERNGLVTSYDSKKHLAKITYMPSGEESGWLRIEAHHVGNGWGDLTGLTPGSGAASGKGGAGSASGGGSGSSGGAGGGSGQQYQGDQVIVRFQEGSLNSGKVSRRVHSKIDVPPQVEAGERLIMHSLGSRIFWKKDGSFHLYGKTSKQDDQSQQGSGSSSGSSAGSSGGASSGFAIGSNSGPSPLKNAPPLQPQTYKLKIDPKGVTTHTHFQQKQQSGGSGGSGGSGQQDPADPTSTESPGHYSTMVTDPVNLKHEHTTHQEDQSSSSSSSGGGSPTPDATQGDPGMDSKKSQQPKMFSQTVHDTKKGQLHHTTYDKNGKKKHQVIFDTNANKITMQTFEEGGENPQHQVLMDQSSGHMIFQVSKGGQQMSQTVMDQAGNISHTAKGQVKMHAQGGFQTQGSWSHSGGFNGDTVNASVSMSAPAGSVPGPTPGTAGGSPGAVGAASFASSGSNSSTG